MVYLAQSSQGSKSWCWFQRSCGKCLMAHGITTAGVQVGHRDVTRQEARDWYCSWVHSYNNSQTAEFRSSGRAISAPSKESSLNGLPLDFISYRCRHLLHCHVEEQASNAWSFERHSQIKSRSWHQNLTLPASSVSSYGGKVGPDFWDSFYIGINLLCERFAFMTLLTPLALPPHIIIIGVVVDGQLVVNS